MATYDPKEVTVIFGSLVLTGFASGQMVNIEQNERTFKQEVGTDGLTCRVRNRNATGKMTVTLMQSSPSNDELSKILERDRLFGDGQAFVQITDFSGRTVLNSPNAYLEGPPNVTFGKDLENREWVFLLDEVRYVNIGGNN